MLSPRVSIAAAAFAAASCLVQDAVAHSYMMEPLAKFPEGYNGQNGAFGSIDVMQWKTVMSSVADYKGAERAAVAIKADGSKTVRDFIMKHVKVSESIATKECGQSITTGPRQALPNQIAYAWGHNGPCEIWCDNTKLFYDVDCNAKFNNTGKVPIDTSKCKGASLLQAMYIGTQAVNWEIYTNCVPLIGGTETDPKKVFKYGTVGETSNDAAPAPAPAANSTTPAAAPATSAPAPARTTAQPPQSFAPTPAPAPVTPKPTCSRRTRS